MLINVHQQSIVIIYKNERFVGSYKFALLIGLTYLKQRLNESLKESGYNGIDSFYLPTTITSESTYFDILARELLIQDVHNEETFILLISNLLFLIEYMTLKENGINIQEYKNKYLSLMEKRKAEISKANNSYNK